MKTRKTGAVDYVVDDTLTDRVYALTSPQVYTEDKKIETLPAAIIP